VLDTLSGVYVSTTDETRRFHSSAQRNAMMSVMAI
jgi:hypothetical protein